MMKIRRLIRPSLVLWATVTRIVNSINYWFGNTVQRFYYYNIINNR